jgi:methionyl aminopeptidase
MVFTVEPMINVGTFETKTLPDRWTICTKDGKLSAQFEHTLAITDGAPEILTLP